MLTSASRSVPQGLEGQVIVVQAADLMQTRKIIPDLATWIQCFGLYAAVLLKQKPEKVSELIAYMTTISKASVKYKWPSWVIYDQNFRQDAAGNPSLSWAKVDPSIYAQCFTGQALSSENWCARCQCLDHTSVHCPYRPRKRTWASAFSQPVKPEPQICIKYNRYNGDCKFGKDCRFKHACSSCGEPHPSSKCPCGGKAARAGPSAGVL